MKAYSLTPAAEGDLETIGATIAADSPAVAVRVIKELRAAMRRLAEFPRMGRKGPRLGKGLHVWVVYSYLIVYRPSAKPLEVVRIVHGSRDLAALFAQGSKRGSKSRD